MASLLETLSQETDLFLSAGSSGLSRLVQESDSILSDLETLEASLLQEVKNSDEPPPNLMVLQPRLDSWYKLSIRGLKLYNNGLGRFTKTVLSNPSFHKDLDDAYLYKLVISDSSVRVGSHTDDSHCKREGHDPCFEARKLENHEQLQKAIYLHLLKSGHSDLVRQLLDDPDDPGSCVIEESVLSRFDILKQVLEDIRERHDLTLALKWFSERHASTGNNSDDPADDDLEFKLHTLQFLLLLGEKGSSVEPPNMQNLMEAYSYMANNFKRFFRDYLNVIKPLTTLLLRRYASLSDGDEITGVRTPTPRIWKEYDGKSKIPGKARGSEFVQHVLDSFDCIHQNQAIFAKLVDEFTEVFCKDMNLSSESSLFQSILAGFVFMPSFHKYTSIERKLSAVRDKALAGKPSAADPMSVIKEGADLPFQLPDGPRFLFHHHPIFTCPISKDQLSPMDRVKLYETGNADRQTTNDSPLVVLNFCQHVALRESVWHLSKKGTEVFKCHYCYKKHKYLDVTNACFIDY